MASVSGGNSFGTSNELTINLSIAGNNTISYSAIVAGASGSTGYIEIAVVNADEVNKIGLYFACDYRTKNSTLYARGDVGQIKTMYTVELEESSVLTMVLIKKDEENNTSSGTVDDDTWSVTVTPAVSKVLHYNAASTPSWYFVDSTGGSTGDASSASGILYVQSVTVGEGGASSSVTGQWYSSDARVYTANSELAKTLNAGKPYHVTLDTGNVITSANAMTELTLSEDFSSSAKLIKTSSNSAGYDTSDAVWYKISGTTESSSVSQTNDIPSTLYGGKAIYVEFINSPDANRIQTIYYRADTAAT